MIKRGILRLAERAGYHIIKSADRERFDRQAAEIRALHERLAQEEAQRGARDAELAALKERLAQELAIIRARDWELERERGHLRRAQSELDQARMKSRLAILSLERKLEEVQAQVWDLRQYAGEEGNKSGLPNSDSKQEVALRCPGPPKFAKHVGSNARFTQQERSLFYIVHFPHHHDRLYAENLSEFLAESGIRTLTVLLDDPGNGNRPQLAECISGDALGVIGFNSQLDRSYLGATPFLKVALEQRVPVIQWMLDHPSSRLAEFDNSSAENSRFLFSSSSAEEYFRHYGMPKVLTAHVASVGPSRHSRIKNLTFRDFSNRPFFGMVAMNLTRIGGTIDDAWQRVRSLEPQLRRVVEQTIESSYLDLIEPLEAHFDRALAGGGLAIAPMLRHACVQMVEEIVQIRRRQKIFEVAREFPLLIQSDAASRPLQAGAKATFKENQDVAVTWARLKLARAQVTISNMHDMVHDRILNGLNAGCANIVEDSYANRRVFEHGRDALFFRYSDDSLRECLEIVCGDLERTYDVAAAGFVRRDDAPFRFGNFRNIIDLARRPFPDHSEEGVSPKTN